MNISVIIPTYNRVNDLEVALDSILSQTLLPIEIIIVDQSDDKNTEKLSHLNKYKILNIKYIKLEIKSSTIARQVWMENLSSESEIMVFFDDDVKLEKNYLEEIFNFMKTNSKILWWWWNIINFPIKKNIINDLGDIIFRNSKISNEFCTTNAQYKNEKKIQNVSSIIWCNMFFKSELAKKYSFESWMKKCWDADDTFFSYQINKDNPKSLFYLPTAKLYHFQSPAGRMIKIEKFKQILYHRYVFWRKYNFPILTYYWWTIWFLIWSLLSYNNKIQIIKEYFKAHIKIIKNWKAIQKDFSNVNDFIYD